MNTRVERTNFGRYLEKIRKNHNVTIEELAEGICDFSLITKIESGERVSSMLLRNRLLERIGTTSEGYENYVRASEFSRWEKRRDILSYIESGDYENAKVYLDDYYLSITDDRILEEQFCLEIKALLATLMKDSSAAEIAGEALKKTVVLDKNGMVTTGRLAPREINLVIEYSACMNREKRQKQLEYMLCMVKERKYDERNLVLFYPKLVCIYIGEFLIDFKSDAKWLSEALKMISESETLLSTKGRLIYELELNEVKKSVWDCVIGFKNSSNDSIWVALADVKRGEYCEKTILSELGEMYNQDVSSLNWDYLYNEEGVKCVGDIIRKRRKMKKIPKEEMCRNICSLDTLNRIEKLQCDPKSQKMRLLLERVGLSGEYQKTNVSVFDIEIKKTEENIVRYSNAGKDIETIKEIDKLKDMIVSLTDEDRQFITMTEAMIKYRKGDISSVECNKMLYDALSYTIPYYELTDEYYMTRSELSCIYNIAMVGKGKGDKSVMDFVKRVCACELAESKAKDVRLLELYLMAAVFIELANKNYEGADWYNTQLIKMELQKKRRGLLYQAFRNKSTIYRLKKEQGIDIADDIILKNEELVQKLVPYKLNQRVK